MAALHDDFLHLVPKPLLDDRRMLAFKQFSLIDEVAVVERVGKDELHAVFVHLVAVQTFHAVLEKKFGYILNTGIAFGVQLEGRLYHRSFLLINDNQLRARIIEIADGSRAGKLAALRFLSQGRARYWS